MNEVLTDQLNVYYFSRVIRKTSKYPCILAPEIMFLTVRIIDHAIAMLYRCMSEKYVLIVIPVKYIMNLVND